MSARKRLLKILGGLFQGQNQLKMSNYTILQMFKNPRRSRQARNFTTILMLRKFQISNHLPNRYFPENGHWVPLRYLNQGGGRWHIKYKCIRSSFLPFASQPTFAYPRKRMPAYPARKSTCSRQPDTIILAIH